MNQWKYKNRHEEVVSVSATPGGDVAIELSPERNMLMDPNAARCLAQELLNCSSKATEKTKILGAYILVGRDDIDAILAGESRCGLTLVADEETGEDWRHGIRRQTVVTDGYFWAIERRVPTVDDSVEWDCRDQDGPEYRLDRVEPRWSVQATYGRVS